jgi:hypothetical protein
MTIYYYGAKLGDEIQEGVLWRRIEHVLCTVPSGCFYDHLFIQNCYWYAIPITIDWFYVTKTIDKTTVTVILSFLIISGSFGRVV